jgi:3-oxoacyl-[acyl-carrier protein] reductase
MPERVPGNESLAGKVALVTGGTRGIGLATAHELAACGATIVLTGRDEVAAKTAAESVGGPVTGQRLDVTDAKAVATLIRGVAKEHGRLDIVVANAGIMEGALLGMIRDDDVQRTLNTNVAGTIHTVQAAARAMMRKKSGSIVVIASVVGERGSAGQTVYAASKAAVANLARSAAKELGGSGIRVNAVAPGVIDTALTSSLSDQVRAETVRNTPLGRLGAADEVAKAVRFLAGEDSSFITGQVLGVDGGLVL